MKQNLDVEQIQALLGEPTKLSRKQILEADVQERTPKYLGLDAPQYDARLMKAHFELATIYEKEMNVEQAYSHFRMAEHEFLKMCKIKTEQPKYITENFDFQELRKNNEETENELNYYKKGLLEIAKKISSDALNLLYTQTSVEPKKNLDGLIKAMYG